MSFSDKAVLKCALLIKDTHRLVAQPIRASFAGPLFAKNVSVVAQLAILQATHLKMDLRARTTGGIEVVQQFLGVIEFDRLISWNWKFC
jgi:hypothetical protein